MSSIDWRDSRSVPHKIDKVCALMLRLRRRHDHDSRGASPFMVMPTRMQQCVPVESSLKVVKVGFEAPTPPTLAQARVDDAKAATMCMTMIRTVRYGFKVCLKILLTRKSKQLENS